MMRFARGIARPKVMPRTDAFNCGAAGQHRPIDQKRAESRSSSTLNQVNNEDDDSDHEQYMDQTAANVAEQAKQPKHEQDDNYSPQHGVNPFPLS
jgi:hypothetical protein